MSAHAGCRFPECVTRSNRIDDMAIAIPPTAPASAPLVIICVFISPLSAIPALNRAWS
ncbi:hypothetical protein [Mycobacterium sp.]|uniref:hypothetical protein n=1 Tax=Mycobacterium sp. TaxID=1785 RepID=UPI0025D737F5|nr:hypothetical protein [Mycobacterium sp.]